MKSKLHWTTVTRQKLADHLEAGRIVTAQAIGDTNLYHCLHEGTETIAISLPGQNSIIIGNVPSVSAGQERRRRRQASTTTDGTANIPPTDNRS